MRFDTFAMVDWSGGNDTGPRPRKDAIWICLASASGVETPLYFRNRDLAERWIADLIAEELEAGRRLCIGFDFPFAYPKGFAQALTGSADPFAVWDWLEDRISDSPRANTRFDVAGEINRALGGGRGPFWANGLRNRDIDGLPRTKHGYANPFPDRRAAEARATGTFTCWQMAGAGAVGGQVMTGLPVLTRLRRRFADALAVWPFEPLTRPVAVMEIWPSLLSDVLAEETASAEAAGQAPIRDALQVQIVAAALAGLGAKDLARIADLDAPEEGWILGLGHETALAAAARKVLEVRTPALPRPPRLTNDCFALPPGVDWTPVDMALARLRSGLHAVTGTEDMPVTHALGRVLAAPAVAGRSHPPAANSAVDGYGFAGGANAGGQVLELLPGRSAAGQPYAGRVGRGQALRILTGAQIPEGVDTVVLEEDVALSAGHVAFNGPLKRGANTRKAGEDVAEGHVALGPGRVLAPQDLALLAAVGIGRVTVRRRLRVGVLSTGDELAEPGEEIGADRIHDANRPMLLGLVDRFGHVPVDLGRVRDDRAALAACLADAVKGKRVDAILTSGGASAGEEDHVSALLSAEGAIETWRIAMKPGRPLALGLWRGVPVFGLPGNPVAAFTCALIFARPALSLLAGAGWVEPQGFDVPAAFEKRKKPGRREYLRARIRDGRAEPFASEGSGRVSGLSWAEGFVELPDREAHVRPGDPVRFLPFGSFGP
ncbi:molybdopterin-binding protein [Chachezhania sediminis]|uniref:molybdopterin-binding protein n=1 Tax=Chachezhania sediminis TaxID=2599291 RepID=UPI00131D58E2|nr:gephyrin-like molybdotransferase Glp [Chachezhania sediminis]